MQCLMALRCRSLEMVLVATSARKEARIHLAHAIGYLKQADHSQEFGVQLSVPLASILVNGFSRA